MRQLYLKYCDYCFESFRTYDNSMKYCQSNHEYLHTVKKKQDMQAKKEDVKILVKRMKKKNA